jgi:hypothetical protein
MAFSQPVPSQANPQNLIVYSSQPQDNTQHSVKNPLTPQISKYIPNSNPKYQWQQIAHGRKRSRNPEEPDTSKKQEHWLGDTVTVNNTFSVLTDEETMEGESSNNEPKSPHIFVSGVKNIKPLVELLNAIAQHKYILKTLYNSQVKVQPLESSTYTTIIKAPTEKQTEFHTYKPRTERGFRVVLKNIHPTTELNEIKSSLQEKGHEVTNIWYVKQRVTKTPLPMYFIDLKLKENNKEIHKIDLHLNTKVQFEAPHVKREIP